MLEDGDDVLNAVGVVLAVLLVAGLAVTVLAAATSSDRADEGPDAAFEFRSVNDTHVEVVHAGGPAVPDADLVVTVDGLQRQVSWPAEVARGDGVTVEARDGSVVRVYWDPGEGERELLGEYRVG
ncbi:MAG: hypothetical protein V5A23_00425 [Halobacteriales archaeon]